MAVLDFYQTKLWLQHKSPVFRPGEYCDGIPRDETLIYPLHVIYTSPVRDKTIRSESADSATSRITRLHSALERCRPLSRRPMGEGVDIYPTGRALLDAIVSDG